MPSRYSYYLLLKLRFIRNESDFSFYLQKNVSGDWELCTGNINFYHDAGSMIKYHKNLTGQGYRALIFRYILFLFHLHLEVLAVLGYYISVHPPYHVTITSIDTTDIPPSCHYHIRRQY